MKHKGKPRTGRVQFLFLGFFVAHKLCGDLPVIFLQSSCDLLLVIGR